MVAVRTGFPSPMQPMRGFPSAALPAGQTPVPAPVPPMPLAGFPPPPQRFPQGGPGTFPVSSNAPRRRRFGDSLEGMLGRNIFATQQQQPMPTPMMPRPMEMGGAVQYFANGGNANQQAAASMLAAGIGNVGGKAITSEAQDIQDRFSGLANRRSRRRRKRRERRAREEAARLAAEQAAAEAAALAALPTGGPGPFPPAAPAPPPPSTDITPEVFIPPSGGIDATPPGFGAMPPSTGMSEGLEILNQMQDAANLQAALGAGIDATPPGFGSVPPVSPVGIQAPDRSIDAEIAGPSLAFDDALALTQGVIPSEVVPENPFAYDMGAIGFGDSRDDTQANLGAGTDPNIPAPPPGSTGVTVPEGTAVIQFGTFDDRETAEAEIERLKNSLKGFPTNYYVEPVTRSGQTLYRIRGTGFNNIDDASRAASAIISQENVVPILTRDSFTTGGLGLPQAGDNIFEQNTFAPEFPALPGNRGFTPSGTQIAPEAATVTPTENFESTRAMLESNVFDPNTLDPRGNQIVSPTGTGIGIPPANTGGSDKDDKSRPRLTSEELESLKASLGEQVPISGIEKVINQVIGKAFFGLGSGFADKLKASSEAERQAIVDQHLNALNSGATPVYNDKGEYVGFNMNTMDTFADKVLAADDISVFLPGGSADADGDGVIDYDRFQQVLDAQSTAADADKFGQSTEQGFITSDGREFFVDATGNVVEVEDGVVPFEIGGGDDVTDIFTETMTTGGGDDGGDSGSDTGVDTGHTVDEDGNIVCNTEGYVYNPETKVCEPAKEEEDDGTPGSGIGTGTSGESFEDVLKRVVVAAPDVAPISANVRPMQEGGMAGLNRAADNFLKALAG